jgi:hypothetical protein
MKCDGTRERRVHATEKKAARNAAGHEQIRPEGFDSPASKAGGHADRNGEKHAPPPGEDLHGSRARALNLSASDATPSRQKRHGMLAKDRLATK